MKTALLLLVLAVFTPAVSALAAYTATASSSHSAHPASMAIDGDNATYWASGTSSTIGSWIQVAFGSTKKVSSISYRSYDNSNAVSGLSVQYSVDGSSWTTAQTFSGLPYIGTLSLTNPVNCSYIRLVSTTNPNLGSGWWDLTELDFGFSGLTDDQEAFLYGLSGLLSGFLFWLIVIR